MSDFYCQNKCVRPDFSIEEWNATFNALNAIGLEMPNREDEVCDSQCFECMAIVGETQRKNRELVGVPKTNIMEEKLLNFGDALNALKSGEKIARTGWNGKGMWLALQVVDENSKMGHNYPYMKGVDGKLFPWNPNCLDLMAEDWRIIS